MATRWTRLERYARWRGRLHLDHLPGDVLAYMAAEFLDPPDLMRLAAAFVGYEPDMYVRRDVDALPAELRTQWLNHSMRAGYEARLLQFARECYPASFDLCMDLHVHVDWSPLAAVHPMPRGDAVGAHAGRSGAAAAPAPRARGRPALAPPGRGHRSARVGDARERHARVPQRHPGRVPPRLPRDPHGRDDPARRARHVLSISSALCAGGDATSSTTGPSASTPEGAAGEAMP